jgi:hypothetical protein
MSAQDQTLPSFSPEPNGDHGIFCLPKSIVPLLNPCDMH